MTTPEQDREHLKLLAIFHYVVAGLAALIACFPLIHLFLGIAMVTGRIDNAAGQDEIIGLAGWFFVALASLFILSGWAFAFCLAVAGRFLAQQRNYTYCIVIAGISCLFVPFGTVLGIFTILVLLRESVKRLFGQGDALVAED